MLAQRAYKQIDSVANDVEIEHLRSQLAEFNRRIDEVEKQHPEASKVEELRASALLLARQIDDLRCASANEFTGLLSK
jgi:Tfp pilus assembly protein PilO